MPSKNTPTRWTIDQKIHLLSEAAKLSGNALMKFLANEGVLFGELEQ